MRKGVLCLGIALFSFQSAVDASEPCEPFGGVTESVCSVSIVRLIAAPRDYDRRMVAVVGYLRSSAAGDLLYLSERSWLTGDVASSLHVKVADNPQLAFISATRAPAYVRVIGRFSATPSKLDEEQYSYTAGALADIVAIRGASIPWAFVPDVRPVLDTLHDSAAPGEELSHEKGDSPSANNREPGSARER